MADQQMIARLADLREFAELTQHFNDLREDEVQKLARKTFAWPEEHDRIEWERLKARWDGIDFLLALPAKQRKNQQKENA